MTLDGLIAATCRSSYMHIRRINTIRQYLTNDAVKTLTQSLVTSRLDCCNIISTDEIDQKITIDSECSCSTYTTDQKSSSYNSSTSGLTLITSSETLPI